MPLEVSVDVPMTPSKPTSQPAAVVILNSAPGSISLVWLSRFWMIRLPLGWFLNVRDTVLPAWIWMVWLWAVSYTHLTVDRTGHKLRAAWVQVSAHQNTGKANGAAGRHTQEPALHLLPGVINACAENIPGKVGGDILQQIFYFHHALPLVAVHEVQLIGVPAQAVDRIPLLRQAERLHSKTASRIFQPLIKLADGRIHIRAAHLCHAPQNAPDPPIPFFRLPELAALVLLKPYLTLHSVGGKVLCLSLIHIYLSISQWPTHWKPPARSKPARKPPMPANISK